MRSDMAKVICERPRLGGSNGRENSHDNVTGHRVIPIDELPSKESMKARHSDRKEFNEHLSPLYRFLNGAVGRPWDDVYSEICERIKLSSTVQRHILEHVGWHVETKTFLSEDGRVCRNGYNGPDYIETTESRYRRDSLYVHPTTGLLCKTKYIKPEKKEAPLEHLIINKDMHLAKVNGIWHRMEVREIPKPVVDYCLKSRAATDVVYPLAIQIPYDVYLKASVSEILCKAGRHGTLWIYGATNYNRKDIKRIYGRDDVYAHRMEQANSKELKKYGLKNAA